jgi:hypothetical protein
MQSSRLARIPGTAGIPATIIQMWGWNPADAQRGIPPRLRAAAETWQHRNRDCAYVLLTVQAFEEGILPQYPWLRSTYFAFTDWVQRADLARLMALHSMGGVYADLDTECLVPVREWHARHPGFTHNASILMTRDTSATPRQPVPDSNASLSVQNWCVAATQHHPLLLRLLRRAVPTVHDPSTMSRARWVLNTTGPHWLTRSLIEELPWLRDAGFQVSVLEETSQAPQSSQEAAGSSRVVLSLVPLFGDVGRRPAIEFLVRHMFTGTWRAPPAHLNVEPVQTRETTTDPSNYLGKVLLLLAVCVLALGFLMYIVKSRRARLRERDMFQNAMNSKE